MLHHVDLDVAHLLPGVVGDHDVGADFFAVVIDFLVQRDFQIDLAAGEREALGDERRWKTVACTRRRRVLKFLDGELDGASLVALVFFVVAYPTFDVVFYAERFALVVFTGLEGDL